MDGIIHSSMPVMVSRYLSYARRVCWSFLQRYCCLRPVVNNIWTKINGWVCTSQSVSSASILDSKSHPTCFEVFLGTLNVRPTSPTKVIIILPGSSKRLRRVIIWLRSFSWDEMMKMEIDASFCPETLHHETSFNRGYESMKTNSDMKNQSRSFTLHSPRKLDVLWSSFKSSFQSSVVG